MKKKVLGYGAMVALLAASSLALVTPAHAAPGTLTISDTTGWTPGQVVSVTLVDSLSDPLCDAEALVPGGGWAIGLEIYDVDDNLVGGAYAMEPTGETYTPGETYSDVDLTINWLNVELDLEAPTYNMDVYVVAVCQDSPFSTVTNVSPAPVNATYAPVEVSSTTVAQDGTLEVTVYDESFTWCSESLGEGHSMAIGLFPVGGGDPIYLPKGVGEGEPGFGSFDWQNVSATATVTIPSSVPAGSYDLFAGCVLPESGDFASVGPGALYGSIEVTGATLPDTGSSADTLFAVIATGITLLAIGSTALVLGRRHRESLI